MCKCKFIMEILIKKFFDGKFFLPKMLKLEPMDRPFSKFQHFFNDKPIKLTWCLHKKINK
jgi:hypothetical protein